MVENAFEIGSHVGVSILIDRQSGRSMLDEEVQDAPARQAFRQLALNFTGDDMVSPGIGLQGKFFL